jgi:hypothetical protein
MCGSVKAYQNQKCRVSQEKLASETAVERVDLSEKVR